MEILFDHIFQILSFVVVLIVLVLSRVNGKSIDKEFIMFLKTLTLDKKPASVKRKYTSLIKTYRLDESTGELVENPDPLDVDKLVESCRSTSLSALLDRFLPQNTVDMIDGVISETEQDLGSVGAALDTLEEYRSKLGLSDDVSVSDVLAQIEMYRDKLVQKARDFEAAEKAQTDDAVKKARLLELQAELDKLNSEVKTNEKKA